MSREELIEAARWKTDTWAFDTGEDFEEKRNEPWFAIGRNHRQVDGLVGYKQSRGIRREIREDGTFEIEDRHDCQGLFVGRTIVKFERDKSPEGNGFTHGDNSVTISLDDGSELYFVACGYDASGLITSWNPSPDEN